MLEGLEVRITPTTATWTGLVGNTTTGWLWATAGNWLNNTPPSNGDDVLFPSLSGTTGSYNSTDNLTSVTSLDSITIGAPSYNLSGTIPFSLALTSPSSNIITTYNSGMSSYSIPTTLGSGTISVASGGTLDVTAVLSGTAGLSLLGGGTLELAGTNTYTGTTTVTTSTLFVDTPTTGPVQLSGGLLGGSSTVGNVTSVGGTISPGHSPSPGILTTGSLTFDSTSKYSALLDGTVPGGYDQIVAGGPINLGGATLHLSIGSGFSPTRGEQFTIIQNNSGSPVTGSFAGLPEASTISVGGVQFQISYAGGPTLNSVVLTVLTNATTTTTLTTSSQIAVVGQPVTFTATVTPAAPSLGIPTGTVTFLDGTTPIGQAPVNSSAQATFTTSSLAFGAHSITAVYSGDSVFQSSTSTAIIQFVTSAATTPTLTIVPLQIRNGKPGRLELVAQLSAAPPATGTPPGNLVFFINGRAMSRIVPVIDGRAVLTLATPRLNNKFVYARYLGYFSAFQPAISNSVLINRWTLRAVTGATTAVTHSRHSSPHLAARTERAAAEESLPGKSSRRA
jgi:hypothetical protein